MMGGEGVWRHTNSVEEAQGGSAASTKRDPAAGVGIVLSPRMLSRVKGSGDVGSRIAWVHIAGGPVDLMPQLIYVVEGGTRD